MNDFFSIFKKFDGMNLLSVKVKEKAKDNFWPKATGEGIPLHSLVRMSALKQITVKKNS